MNNIVSFNSFHPNVPDAAGVLSWVHIGDLHMTKAGEQNDLDLRAIVEEINAAFASSVSFVYLPGDVADDGSSAAYAVVRESLDRLKVPWCAIIGDHDVHDKSFANFLSSMAAKRNYTFTVGNVRFLAMNAFDIPDPRSFAVLPEQMQWVEQQLEDASAQGQSKVLLLHCYPTDLKVGRDHLVELVQKHNVRLIDMGHTHYNEVANDGRTIYTATRSTGQIEEGPVGFSLTNLDDGVVSWRFLELGELPAVTITSPSDERLITDSSEPDRAAVDGLRVRAKAWGKTKIQRVHANLEQERVQLRQVPGSQVWEALLPTGEVPDGVYTLRIWAEDADGQTAEDTVRVLVGNTTGPARGRLEQDQDNALPAWPEHGLLGTQLGPNKNGRKW
jgi:Icc protein